MQNQRSEMASLLAQIDEKNRAAKRGLSAYAAVANHECITKRIEQGAPLVFQLFDQGRYEDGVALWDAWIDSLRTE